MKLEFCASNELPQTRWLDAWKDEVTVEKSSDGLVVYSSLCPHNGGKLVRKGDRLACPWHGAEFAVATGKCLNAKLPRQHRYRAEIAEGKVWVRREDR